MSTVKQYKKRWTPTTVSTHHAKLTEAMRDDDNCHLHIGITIKTSHATCAAASAMAIDKGLAAAGDDIHTLYVHSIIKVSQVQLLGVKCT